ncbi:MAG: MFS transporter [Bacteroidales bacterium]|nr:MFS transporter [Bacteroidales bacterium]
MLRLLLFLQFAIWGAYLICLGQYLGASGLGAYIAWFYSAQGFVAIFMPTLMGYIADRWIPSQRMLALCHLLSSSFMLGAWYYGTTHEELQLAPFLTLYVCALAFYMPTIALCNATCFKIIKQRGGEPVKQFPAIRMWGTIGFIAAMWLVNSLYYHDGEWGFTLSDSNPMGVYRFQYTDMQLLASSLLGFITVVYCLFLPNCPVAPAQEWRGLRSLFGLDAFQLFKTPQTAIFLCFAVLIGVELQISNGYATTFITSFKGVPSMADTFGANNATLLTSLSQISEALCILLIPFFMRRYGIKVVILMAMGGWALRFGLFGLGDTGEGLWMLILSMIVYGVAFDFYNVSGALYIDQVSHHSIKASAQGLFMLMTNGIGATVGMLGAGAVVNHYCHWATLPGGVSCMIGNWPATWLVFAAYAALIMLLFALLFRPKPQKE